MSRAELWAALADATDAVQAATDAYERAPTPQTREAMDAAFHEYVQRLIWNHQPTTAPGGGVVKREGVE